MAGLSISPSLNSRIQILKSIERKGDCVLYIMSRDIRASDNHALIVAQREALKKQLPLGVVFVLKARTGNRAREHYEWMIESLKEVEIQLNRFNIPFLLLIGEPLERLKAVTKHVNPESVYFDFNPLNGPTKLRNNFTKESPCSVYVVDTHNIVPVWLASDKLEVGARTLRPKIHRQIALFLYEPEQLVKHPFLWPGPVMKIAELQTQIDTLVNAVPSNGQRDLLKMFPTGMVGAEKTLTDFLHTRLKSYASERNDPTKNGLSGLSPYLHYGIISSFRVILRATELLAQDSTLLPGYDCLIEEMVVRKELSDNFCYYNPSYLTIKAAPSWAQDTLHKHADDPREFVYSKEVLEQAKTHDAAWNAAQIELLKTGKMHGYMRMYWAKKVLEWSHSPEEALALLQYLNDFYSIDGGDPNGYVGILWSVAGVHDRPWGERPIYGNIRSMVYNGLKRKFAIDEYIAKWTS